MTESETNGVPVNPWQQPVPMQGSQGALAEAGPVGQQPGLGQADPGAPGVYEPVPVPQIPAPTDPAFEHAFESPAGGEPEGVRHVEPEEGTVLIDAAPPGTDAYLDEMDDNEATVFVHRGPVLRWYLVLVDGRAVELPGDDLVIGRNPRAEEPIVRVRVPDAGKTMSKTHARLRLIEERWYVTDLDSTNGVLFYSAEGEEIMLPPQQETLIDGDFILGTVPVSIQLVEEPNAQASS